MFNQICINEEMLPICVCVCVCTFIHIYIYKYICIHKYIYIFTHIYTHIYIQELFKWAVMKIKPSKCCSLSIIKGNCRDIKFFVDGNEFPTILEKSVKNFGRCYSLPLTNRHRWQDLSKLLKDELRSIDKCDLLNKVWCIYFGLFPKLSWRK